MFKTKRDLAHAIICFFLFTSQNRISIQCEFEFDFEFIIIKILFIIANLNDFFYIVNRKCEFIEIFDIKRSINDYVNI
jgi:hypothetical protein